ncbi:hypothetical protein PAEPH01_0593 [Pancytospora epiphaga]|nr:hypothetical protein PAEPH01_0593 [Pancytospora epiphaga]
MEEKYDLVHHPFYVSKPENTMLFKTSNGYEIRLGNTLLTKKIISTENASEKNFIELEIIGGEVKMLSETSTLHEFTTPADFYVPMEEKSRDAYTELSHLLVNDSLEELCKISEKYIDGGFPECPVPRTTTASHHHNFTVRVKAEREDSAKCASIRFGEDIPTSAPEAMKEFVKQKIEESSYELQDRFFKKYFSTNKIANFKDIEKVFSKECGSSKLQPTYLKNCVALHAFYYSSGPWRHSWVAFGYDPSGDRNNYKYQLITVEGRKRTFRPIEYPEIVNEISCNMDWYVQQECDATAGFVSKSLRDLFAYRTEKTDGEKDDDYSNESSQYTNSTF